jgi:hypothetical protein
MVGVMTAREQMQQVAEIILAHLGKSRSPDQVYLPIFQAIAERALDPPDALVKALHRAGKHPDIAGWRKQDLAVYLLSDAPLRLWLAEQDLGGERADFIHLLLEYAGIIGPALGRALLHMTNPRYMVLLMMRIQTPSAPYTLGQWPDKAPYGEGWSAREGEWIADPARPWKPVPTEIIRARIEADQAGEKRVFPDGFEGDVRQLNVAERLSEAARSLREELEKAAHPLAESPLQTLLAGNGSAGHSESLPEPPASFVDCHTALEMAWPSILPHDLVRRCDCAAERRGWKTTEFPADLLSIEIIRKVDAHARELCRSGNPIQQAAGQRILGATIQNLVSAGVLCANTATRKKVLTEWPFAFDGMRTRPVTESALEANLARHLAAGGSRTLGRQRMEIWVSTHRNRSHTYVE